MRDEKFEDFFSKIGLKGKRLVWSQDIFSVQNQEGLVLGKFLFGTTTVDFISELQSETVVFELENEEKIKKTFQDLSDLINAQLFVVEISKEDALISINGTIFLVKENDSVGAFIVQSVDSGTGTVELKVPDFKYYRRFSEEQIW